jgi:signal transduction histidine kinase
MHPLPDPSSPQPGLVRPEIVSSWERSVLAGLSPEQFEVPYVPDVDARGRLTWAAAAILDRVAQDLAGSGIGLLLTDERGHVVDRKAPERGVLSLLDRIELAPGFLYSEERVGTNAIGTAIAQRSPSVVTGSEHFADALVPMACAACPITDANGQLIGVIDLTCQAHDFSPLMLPLAKRAAWEIEQRFSATTRTHRNEGRGNASDGRTVIPGWSSLNRTERIVSELVAEGLTNREVGSRMAVSPHTISSHLQRIFRKLNITSRVELARVTELVASRDRIVAAADDARRRIERDLHDGLQQRLVSLGLTLRLAETSVPAEAQQLKGELARVAEDLMGVLENVREISHGVHPAFLSQRGLASAVRTLARRSPLPVNLDLRVEGRLPDRVEVCAYYVVSEALANAAKHSKAALISVSVESREGSLSLSIQDDGVGGADINGSGLTGLIERVDALDGTTQLVSRPGSGTSLHVILPINPR